MVDAGVKRKSRALRTELVMRGIEERILRGSGYGYQEGLDSGIRHWNAQRTNEGGHCYIDIGRVFA